MTTCEACATENHDTATCANRDAPMIARTCTCKCDRTLTLGRGYLLDITAAVAPQA